MQRRHLISLFTVFALAAVLFTGPVVPTAQAGVDDVLFGVTSSQDMVNFSVINASNFARTFSYAMSDAITISGTVKLDINANGVTDETGDEFAAFTNQWGWEQNDLWVWVDGHNTQ